jgi:hypothetical protein
MIVVGELINASRKAITETIRRRDTEAIQVTHSQVPPAMLRERAAGGQNLAMDNPPLTGHENINRNKKV